MKMSSEKEKIYNLFSHKIKINEHKFKEYILESITKNEKTKNYFIRYTNKTISKRPFYLYAFVNVFYGYLLRIFDKYRNDYHYE